jgi:hypothetical protein
MSKSQYKKLIQRGKQKVDSKYKALSESKEGGYVRTGRTLTICDSIETVVVKETETEIHYTTVPKGTVRKVNVSPICTESDSTIAYNYGGKLYKKHSFVQKKDVNVPKKIIQVKKDKSLKAGRDNS